MPNDLKKLAIADVKRTATVEEREYLLRRPEEWRTTLVAILQDLDLQISRRNADLQHIQSTSHRKGTDTAKQEYFEEKSKHQTWKGSALDYKRRVVERLRQVKVICTEANEQQDREKRDGAESDDSHPACQLCEFWDTEEYRCHRRAPTPVTEDTDYEGVWPMTQPGGWCGDFRQKAKKRTRTK